MNTILLCLLNTALMVTGQMLFKTGASGKTIRSLTDVIQLLFTPIILTALVLYAGTTCLWLYILSKTPISQAYPIQALAFPAVAILSTVFFREPATATKFAGLALIVLGVYITTR